MSFEQANNDPIPLASSHQDRPIDASCFNAQGPAEQSPENLTEEPDLATGKSEGHCFHSFPAPQFANEPASQSKTENAGSCDHRNNNQLPAAPAVAVRAIRKGPEAGTPAIALGEVMSNQQIHIIDHDQDPQPQHANPTERTISVESGSPEQAPILPQNAGAPGLLTTAIAVGGGALIHGLGKFFSIVGRGWGWIAGPGLEQVRRWLDRGQVWASRELNFNASRGASVAIGVGVVGLAFGTGLLVNWVYSPVQVSVQEGGNRPVLTTIHVAGTPRVLGLNYLVVKSYQDRATAEKTRDQLNRAGIPCTVERGLAGFTGPSWYSVVGLSGFETVGRDARYEQVMSSLREMRFEPKPYKWREDSFATVPLD